jgi:uncharacterized PurR-regulated membrane protein YhhQ (DUF165 family)
MRAANVDMRHLTYFIVFLYIAAAVAANLLVARLGPWSSPIIAFFLIGMDLSLRDYLHERWAGRALPARMAGLIAVAGAVSYLLNPASGMIAIASVTAFCAAALIDAAVYQALIRKRFLVRSNSSNAVAAFVDSLLFPTIAFGAFLPAVIGLQFAMKVAGGFLWSLALRRYVGRLA